MAGAKNKLRSAVIIPNWNGEVYIVACLRSLQNQTMPVHIIVVDNGSVDNSVQIIKKDFPEVEIICLPKNIGFAGGVNVGIRRAIEQKYIFVGLLNNDAVAEPTWFEQLTHTLDKEPAVGIATAKITDLAGEHIDSTGEFYTIWGLSFARGRGEPADDRYDGHRNIFGASGGASIFRTSMLQKIGLFDEDFFAYYEDMDLSFRAQLAGWQVRFTPDAVVRHHIGATSGKLRGFTTYQTLKNLPLLCIKNIPARFLPSVVPRLLLAYAAFFGNALAQGQGSVALRGWLMGLWLTPKKLMERRNIQRGRTVPVAYIGELLVRDLPPGADRLRKLVHPLTYKRNENIS